MRKLFDAMAKKKKVEDKICPAELGNKCKAWEFDFGKDGDVIMDQFDKEYTKRFSVPPRCTKKIFKKLLQKKWYDANIYVKQNQPIFKNPELFNNYSDEEQKLLEIFRGKDSVLFRMFYQTVELIFKSHGKKPQDVPNEMHGFWTAHMSPTDSKILKNEIDAAGPAAGGRKRRKKKSIRRKTKHKRKRKRKSKTKRKRKSKTKRKRKSKKTQKKTKQTKKLLKF